MAHHGDSTHNPLSRLDQIERQPVEGSRLIRDNLQNVLRPLVQLRSQDTILTNNRVTLSHWIQGRSTPAMNSPATIARGDNNSFVINMEEMGNPRHVFIQELGHFVPVAAPLDSADDEPDPEPAHMPDIAPAPDDARPEQNQNNPEENDILNLPITPEIAYAFDVLRQYSPFMIILLTKTLYDYLPSAVLFVGLTGTFTYSNKKLKQEIAKHSQRQVGSLLCIIAHLVITICVYFSFYRGLKLYLSVVFIPPYVQPLTAVELLWMVGGNDFILKLVTMIIKVFVTLIPHTMFPAKRRGKWYVAVETTSQLYRSLVPIQPWLYYLLESYQGPHKVVGVFLSAAYMVAKGTNLMSRARPWWASMVKLLETVQFGKNPTKDDLSQAGPNCPICHDLFDTPVLLSCRHIFCENCVARWFDSEQTCPMCRAKLFNDPSWRDGSTTHFVQVF